MKELVKVAKMLALFGQIGLSAAFPMAGFIILAVWLRRTYELGVWVLIVGIVFGLAGAVEGFRTSLKVMERFSDEGKGESNGYSEIHHL